MKFAPTAAAAFLILWSSAAASEIARLRWLVPDDPAAAGELDALILDEQPAAPAPAGLRSVTLRLPPGARLEITGGSDLAPEPLPGFGNLYNDARAVLVAASDQETLTGDDDAPVAGRRLAAGDWAGVRGRFLAYLVKADVPLALDAAETSPERPVIGLATESGAESITLTFYAGPVDPRQFPESAPELSNLLYASLWEPLRQLSFGLRWLLDGWQSLVGHWGLAILLLSLSVKLLMAPLIVVAERWQSEVNRIQSRMQPELDAIKREFKGEDAHNRTLAVYRQHGVRPFYALKSLAGFLIQIPVFIAAFDMLGEHSGLHGAAFLWVRDLAMPEQALLLPLTLPFLGSHLNLLPILMTALTVLAARLQADTSLSPALWQRQRLRLYAMAALFFVLLYTFPSGMVLYWTANNFWHLVRVLFDKLRRQPES
jgi:YidC/Oxa1 family membrane protein insertase